MLLLIIPIWHSSKASGEALMRTNERGRRQTGDSRILQLDNKEVSLAKTRTTVVQDEQFLSSKIVREDRCEGRHGYAALAKGLWEGTQVLSLRLKTKLISHYQGETAC